MWLASLHNKVPQAGWPKTTENYSLTVLEVSNLRSRFQQGWVLLEALRRELSPAPLLLLVVSTTLGIPLLEATLLSSLSLCLHLCLCPSLPLFASYIGWGLTLYQHDLVFTWLHLQRAHFQIRPHSQLLWVRSSPDLSTSLEEHFSTHCTLMVRWWNNYRRSVWSYMFILISSLMGLSYPVLVTLQTPKSVFFSPSTSKVLMAKPVCPRMSCFLLEHNT